MIRGVRHGKEHEEEVFEPVVWPPRRRSEPAPSRREEPARREEPTPAEPRRKRGKTPA